MTQAYSLGDVIIQRPASEVFAYVTNVENAPRWISGVLEYAWTTDEPPRQRELQYLLALHGQRVEVRERVQVYDPPHTYEVVGAAGPFAYQLTYTFDRTPAGVWLRLTLHGLTQGWRRLVEPILWLALQGRAQRDLQRLKTILEREVVLV